MACAAAVGVACNEGSSAVGPRAGVRAALWQSIGEASESQGGTVQGQCEVSQLVDRLRVLLDVAELVVHARELRVEMW